MADKEKNFISAVVYLGDEKAAARCFVEAVCAKLSARFANYELVFVEDASRDGTVDEVRAALDEMEAAPPTTIIHMSLKQGREIAMNAGLDMAIGDFVYEFDTMQMPYPTEYIDKAYDTCLEGSDIVSVAPSHNRSLSSTLFYHMFNSSSGSKYRLRTDIFRVLSRRAINRVHSISATIPYRKATYAACGLKLTTLTYEGKAGKLREEMRTAQAVDSLALYTSVGMKVSIGIAVVMLVLMVAAAVYTLILMFGAQPVSGWVTTMLLMSGGFFGVFCILAIVLKYLSLLVELVFKKQTYLVESVEKLV